MCDSDNSYEDVTLPDLYDAQQDLNTANSKEEESKEEDVKVEDDTERGDGKRNKDEDKPMPALCTHYKVDYGDDYDSNSEDDEEIKDDRANMKIFKMKQGFFSGNDGIFIDKNENNDGVDNKEVTNQNDPKQNLIRQKATKRVRNNDKKKSKTSHRTNSAIRYQNNKKKKLKKLVKSKVPSSNNEEVSDSIPAPQERSRDDSSSDDDNVKDCSDLGRNRNEDQFKKSETWKERSRSTSIPEWKRNDTDTNDVYNDNNDEKTTLQLN